MTSLLPPVALRFGSYQPKDKQPHEGYVSTHADNPEEDIWGDAHGSKFALANPPSHKSMTASATTGCGSRYVALASSPTPGGTGQREKAL